jgi:hypothetical protein
VKAFDSILDKGSRDSGFDFLTSRSLSRDVDTSLRFEQFQKQVQDKQRVAVAGNFFAMACPIMPMGLMALFSFLGKFGNEFEDPKAMKLEAEEAQRQRGELTQALYLAAMRKKMETDRKLDVNRDGLQCSRPVDALLPLGEKRSGKKKKEVSVMFEGKRSEQINGPKLLTSPRAQADVGKLVKAKMQLESHLDRMSQEQDYGAVCRVSARLELLDKALKRLGC